jgi:hypothetical protein
MQALFGFQVVLEVIEEPSSINLREWPVIDALRDEEARRARKGYGHSGLPTSGPFADLLEGFRNRPRRGPPRIAQACRP